MKKALLILLVSGLTACVSVRPVLTPASFIPQQNPELVWVTSQQGEVIPIARPSLRGDTLVGHWLGTREPVSVMLPQVQIQARQPDHKRTVFAVASIGLLASFVVYRAMSNSGGPRSSCHFDGSDNVGWICP